MDCKCDGRLEALIIEGEPESEILEAVWEKMHDEFIEKMQDEDGTYLRDQVRDRNLLLAKIDTVTTIVDYLRWLLTAKTEVYLDEILAELNTWSNLVIRLDQSDKVACNRSLDMVMAHVSNWKVEREQLRIEMEKSLSGQEGKEVMDREYFDQLLVALSIANKFKVNRKETTAGEFVIMYHALRKQISEAKDFSNN